MLAGDKPKPLEELSDPVDGDNDDLGPQLDFKHRFANPEAVRKPSEVVSVQSFQLKRLFASDNQKLSEASVKRGVELLGDLKQVFQKYDGLGSKAVKWRKLIEGVQKQAAEPRTIIGVIGSSGVGKSSNINALLDEERLVYVMSPESKL